METLLEFPKINKNKPKEDISMDVIMWEWQLLVNRAF